MLNILKRVVGVVAVLVVGAAGCSLPVTQDALEGLRVVKGGDGRLTLTNATMGPVHLESAVLNRGACTMVPHEAYGQPILMTAGVGAEDDAFALTPPIRIEVGAQIFIQALGCEGSANIVFIELNFTEGSGGFSF